MPSKHRARARKKNGTAVSRLVAKTPPPLSTPQTGASQDGSVFGRSRAGKLSIHSRLIALLAPSRERSS